MLEDTLTLAFRAPAAFTAAAQRPVPAYMLLLANFLAFSTAAYAVNFTKSAISMSVLSHYSPAVLLLALAAGLALALPAGFAAAAVLHGLMRAAGGTAGFARSFQALSLLSALIVLQAMLNWFELAWALPSLLGAYLGMTAAHRLHGAPKLRAAIVFCLAAAAALAGQWWLRGQLHRVAGSVEAARGRPDAAPAGAPPADIDERLEKLPEFAMPLGPSDDKQPSGLDLLSGPPASRTIDPQQQAQAMQQAASSMLAPITSMLNDPRVTHNMSPEQAQQVKELTAMLTRMQSSMAEGKALSAQEQNDMMRKFQAMTMRLMHQIPRGPARPPAGPGER
jgi:hypothetical protein